MNKLKTKNCIALLSFTILFAFTMFCFTPGAGADSPTLAAVDLNTSLSQGYVSDPVQLTASNLLPNHYYNVYFDTGGDVVPLADPTFKGWSIYAGDTWYTVTDTVQSDPSGSLSFYIGDLPEMYGGTTVFLIKDNDTEATVAQTNFTVFSSISLSTTRGPVGSELFLQVMGFSNAVNVEADAIKVTVGGVSIDRSSFDWVDDYFSIEPYFGHDWYRSWGGNDGDLAIALQLPASVAIGNTVLTVTDETTGDTVSASFTVTTATFSATINGNAYGYCGDYITITASGLAQNTAYKVSIDSGTSYILNGAEGTMTDSNGNLQATVWLPNIQHGLHDILLFDLNQYHFHISSPALIAHQTFRTSQVTIDTPDSVTAGVPFQIIVTVSDINGNLMTDYTGTMHFTSSDTGTHVVLPADYTFTLSDHGSHTFSVTLTTADNIAIYATDTSGNGIMGFAMGFDVLHGPAAGFLIQTGMESRSHPNVATAGQPLEALSGSGSDNIVAYVVDAYGNLLLDYSGTIRITSTDSQAVLSSDVTLSPGLPSDIGLFEVTLKTAGTQTVTVTDISNPSITGTSNGILVQPAAADHFIINTVTSQMAGSAFNVEVTAMDAYGNIATGYAGTVHFTSSDPQAVLSANSILTGGAGTFQVTLKTAGDQTITVTDTVTSSITATSNSFTINHASATALAVAPKSPSVITAGTNQAFTATATDPYGNSWTVTSDVTWAIAVGAGGSWSGPTYTSSKAGQWTVTATLGTLSDTVTLTVNPAGLDYLTISPFNEYISAGQVQRYSVNAYDQYSNLISSDIAASFKVDGVTISGNIVTETVAGKYTIEASYNGKTVTTTLTVMPAGLASLSISPPGSHVIAGSVQSYSVSAYDRYGNVINARVSASFKVNGVSISGSTVAQTIAGTYLIEACYNGKTVTTTLTVDPAAASSFTVTAPFSASAGTGFSVVVTAKDAYGNIATGYTGSVHFTSTDSLAILSADSILTNGVGTFAVKLRTAGAQTITATDSATSAFTATSGTITVIHAAIADFIVISPIAATIKAGNAQDYSTTAYDVYGNTWMADASYLVNGVATNGSSIMQRTVGTYNVTAIYGGKSSTSTLTVTHGAVANFTVTVPSTVNAKELFTISITAFDAYGNIAKDFMGPVALAISQGSIQPTSSGAFTDGTWSGSIRANNPGTAIITVTDSSGDAGTSNSIYISETATPTPTPTLTQAPTPSPTPTPTSIPTGPSPTPIPKENSTIHVSTSSGTNFEIIINGNITNSQLSNVTLTSYSSTQTTIISLTITGPSGTLGFSNMTIPKSQVPYGTTPLVYIDGQLATEQGYTEDANNYYVWYTTHFSTHQVQIQYTGTTPTTSSPISTPTSTESPNMLWGFIGIITVAVLVGGLLYIARKKRLKASAH